MRSMGLGSGLSRRGRRGLEFNPNSFSNYYFFLGGRESIIKRRVEMSIYRCRLLDLWCGIGYPSVFTTSLIHSFFKRHGRFTTSLTIQTLHLLSLLPPTYFPPYRLYNLFPALDALFTSHCTYILHSLLSTYLNTLPPSLTVSHFGV